MHLQHWLTHTPALYSLEWHICYERVDGGINHYRLEEERPGPIMCCASYVIEGLEFLHVDSIRQKRRSNSKLLYPNCTHLPVSGLLLFL
jgi:hypothetical protein